MATAAPARHDGGMTDAATPAPEVIALRTAAQNRARRDQLDAQLRIANALVEQRAVESAEAEQKVAAESADVRRLEGFSPAKVWSVLRGDIDDRLAVERAEQQAAEHAAAGARERLDHARADADRLTAERDALGDVDTAFALALDAEERVLRLAGGDVAGELVRIDTAHGERVAQRLELSEATAAATYAQQALDAAQASLDSAGGWSTYDTFFNGGFLADMMKHDHIEQSRRAFAEVNRALETLAAELADIDAAPVHGVQISESLAVFDVLFDNIFSDWTVRERIADAQHDAADLRMRLGVLVDDLSARTAAAEQALADLDAERERLLLASR